MSARTTPRAELLSGKGVQQVHTKPAALVSQPQLLLLASYCGRHDVATWLRRPTATHLPAEPLVRAYTAREGLAALAQRPASPQRAQSDEKSLRRRARRCCQSRVSINARVLCEARELNKILLYSPAAAAKPADRVARRKCLSRQLASGTTQTVKSKPTNARNTITTTAMRRGTTGRRAGEDGRGEGRIHPRNDETAKLPAGLAPRRAEDSGRAIEAVYSRNR